jgi:hypothetical protein
VANLLSTVRDRVRPSKETAPPPAPGDFTGEPRSQAGHRVVRGLIVALLGLVVLLGTLDLAGYVGRLFTDPAPPPAPVETIDTAAASALAVGFTADYLTYDEATPTYRADALTRWTAGTATAQPPWDGPGRLTTDLVTPGTVAHDGPDRVIVQTQARVTRWTADGVVPIVPSTWLTLDVVIVRTEGGLRAVRATFTGDNPLPLPNPAGETDGQLTNTLYDLPADLFGALATGELTYVTTPDVQLTGLTRAVQLVDVTGWKIQTGGATRYATADVTWQLADTGLQITQSYALRITEVDGRWLLDAYSPVLED